MEIKINANIFFIILNKAKGNSLIKIFIESMLNIIIVGKKENDGLEQKSSGSNYQDVVK